MVCCKCVGIQMFTQIIIYIYILKKLKESQFDVSVFMNI
jgi:hypothetical protein